MRSTTAVALLFLAALLEVGGDAVIRLGLRAPASTRVLWLGVGGVILFGYGYLVNVTPLDFGRLMGVYIALFFLVSQAIAWLLFSEVPSPGVWLGGMFILVGGLMVFVSSR